jgi:hypothetical protein
MSLDIELSQGEKKFQEFIGLTNDVFTYLHNTESLEIAESIVKNGFEFEGYLDHTTDLISGDDPIELRYFQIKRGRYGDFTMVMQISRSLIDKYCELLKESHNHYSEVLSIKDPIKTAEREPIYTLPPHFVKGFFNQKTKEVVLNPDFDPFRDLDVFGENAKRIIVE